MFLNFFHADQINSFTRINRNFFKPPVSEEVKNLVRNNFTREVEFYQFCKQRLYRQYRALKLPSDILWLGSNNFYKKYLPSIDMHECTY